MLPLVQSSSHTLGLYCSGRKRSQTIKFMVLFERNKTSGMCHFVLPGYRFKLQFSIFRLKPFISSMIVMNCLFCCWRHWGEGSKTESPTSCSIKEPVTQYTEGGQNKRKRPTKSRMSFVFRTALSLVPLRRNCVRSWDIKPLIKVEGLTLFAGWRGNLRCTKCPFFP